MAFKNHYNYDKLIKNTKFNEKLSIKFYPYKKTTIKNNLPIKTFKISWCHANQSYELKNLFIITLCYDNVDDYEFLRL